MNEPKPALSSPPMDELAAIGQLLAEPPPTPDVTATALARLNRATRGTQTARWLAPRGIRSPRWHAPRPRWHLAVSAGLAAAVAAGFITAQLTASGGTRQADTAAVHELAYRAAAAAVRQPTVSPGQWVFWQEKTGGGGCRPDCGTFHVWTTANSQQAAWVYQGRVVSLGDGPFIGQPLPSAVPLSKGGGYAWGYEGGKIPVSYAGLGSLPSDPVALDRYLAHVRVPSAWGPPPGREFVIIEMLLTSYVMPPQLTAELYRALGHIPGVTVSDHAKDVAGRSGVGFISPALPGAGNVEIILNPGSYQLMGDNQLFGSGRLIDGTAIVQMALVARPGVWP